MISFPKSNQSSQRQSSHYFVYTATCHMQHLQNQVTNEQIASTTIKHRFERKLLVAKYITWTAGKSCWWVGSLCFCRPKMTVSCFCACYHHSKLIFNVQFAAFDLWVAQHLTFNSKTLHSNRVKKCGVVQGRGDGCSKS